MSVTPYYSEGSKLSRVLRFVAIGFIILITLFPFFWMISTSFKPVTEWTPPKPKWIPGEPTLYNYKTVFLGPGRAKGGWWQSDEGVRDSVDTEGAKIRISGESSFFLPFITSVIICSSATVLSIAIGTLTAYSISRYKFGGNFFSFFILSARMFPPIAVVIPLVVMFAALGLLDSRLGVTIVYTGFTLPFSVWMIKSFLDDIPHELEEAAVVDGMTNFEALLKVTLPLAKGGIAATALFIFILNWSEFLIAFLLTSSRVMTLPILISRYFSTTQGHLYGPQAALGTIATIPVIIFGFIIQKHLVRGLTFGAVKK
jgi:multiple sugar transport system permease protein